MEDAKSLITPTSSPDEWIVTSSEQEDIRQCRYSHNASTKPNTSICLGDVTVDRNESSDLAKESIYSHQYLLGVSCPARWHNDEHNCQDVEHAYDDSFNASRYGDEVEHSTVLDIDNRGQYELCPKPSRDWMG